MATLTRLSAETPNGVIAAVSLGHFLSHVYFLSFPPLFPLLFAEFSVSYAELGLLVSALYGAMLVFQIPFGWVVDRGHAKAVVVGGIALTAGGIVGASTATSYPVLLGFAFVSGIGQATFHPADYALLDAVSGTDRAGRTFSIHTFAGYAGSGVAPVVVGGLGTRYGWRFPLVAVGVVGVVYAVAVHLGVAPVRTGGRSTGPSPPSPTGQSVRAFLRPAVVAMFLFFVVLIVGESGIQSFTVVFVVETLGVTESTGNGALTAFFVLAAAGILLGGVLADRFDAGVVAVCCLLVATGFTAVLALGVVPGTAVGALATFGGVGFAYGVVMPSRDRLVADYSPAESVGKSFGLVFTGAAVGGSVGPVLLGVAIDRGSVAVSMVLVAASFLAAAAIVVAVRAWRGPTR